MLTKETHPRAVSECRVSPRPNAGSRLASKLTGSRQIEDSSGSCQSGDPDELKL
jgi:hypothetical protein